MAIQKELVDNVGNVSSYHKISRIVVMPIDDKECSVTLDVSSYASKAYRDKSVMSSNSDRRYTFTCKYQLDNIMTTCYNHLKSLSEFENAVDV